MLGQKQHRVYGLATRSLLPRVKHRKFQRLEGRASPVSVMMIASFMHPVEKRRLDVEKGAENLGVGADNDFGYYLCNALHCPPSTPLKPKEATDVKC